MVSPCIAASIVGLTRICTKRHFPTLDPIPLGDGPAWTAVETRVKATSVDPTPPDGRHKPKGAQEQTATRRGRLTKKGGGEPHGPFGNRRRLLFWGRRAGNFAMQDPTLARITPLSQNGGDHISFVFRHMRARSKPVARENTHTVRARGGQ